MPVVNADKPVVSRISDEIFRRLETLGDLQNSVMQFESIERPTRLATYTPKHGTVVLTRGEVARVPDLDCPGNPPSLAYKQTFLIRVHIAPSERDETPIELYEDVAEAEVIRAIKSDPLWHQFDGNAINAEFSAVVLQSDDGGYAGIAVPVDVTYRVTEGDPFEVRA